MDRARGWEAPGSHLSASPRISHRPTARGKTPDALRSGPGEWASPRPGPMSLCSEQAFVEQVGTAPGWAGALPAAWGNAFHLVASLIWTAGCIALCCELEAKPQSGVQHSPHATPGLGQGASAWSRRRPDQRAAILQDAWGCAGCSKCLEEGSSQGRLAGGGVFQGPRRR